MDPWIERAHIAESPSDMATWIFTIFALCQLEYDTIRYKHRDNQRVCDPFKFKFNMEYLDKLVVSKIPGQGDPDDFKSMCYHQYLISSPITPEGIHFVLSLRIRDNIKGCFIVKGTFDDDQLLNQFTFTGHEYQKYLKYKLLNS